MAKKHVNVLLKFFTTLQAELQQRGTSSHPGKDAAVKRLMQRARKRALIPSPGLKEATIEKFVSLNDSLHGKKHGLAPEILHRAKEFLQVVLEGYTKTLDPDGVQETLHLESLFENWRFGPGTSNNCTGTHTAEKLSQKMSCTSKCLPYVVELRKLNTYLSAIDGGYGVGASLIYGSKLAVVHKNETAMRTIATEPLGNMAMQLAAGRYIENALRRIGLDITNQQQKNKLLARLGSLSGLLATVDLTNASDMISMHLIRALWPSEWYDLFMNIRSPFILIPGREQPVIANMMSTMGNGFTFPMMTLTLLALVIANRGSKSRDKVDWTQTAVFGDDIIVPAHEYRGLCEVLESAGLVVNHDKSYSEGPFRESCGGDYYEGYDVTPFYVKTLKDDSGTYVAINQLLDWCGKHNIFLPRSLAVLLAHVKKARFVPEWMNPDQGILVAQVAAKYEYLQPKPVRVRLTDDRYAMMLACGGYLVAGHSRSLRSNSLEEQLSLPPLTEKEIERGNRLFFSPRVDNPRMTVKKGRLPKGYLSGWDPGKRSQLTSDHILAHLRMVG